MLDRIDDFAAALRMLLGSVATLTMPGILIAYPFLVGGTAGLLDLIALTVLALITYWYLNPPRAISSRWLRRPVGSGPSLQDRIFDWLDAPAARQSVLSAWPPMLGVFAGRFLANGWTPPRGPMVLYMTTLGLFATVTTVNEAWGGGPNETRATRWIGRGLLWSASIASFLWLAASTRGYFNPYY